MKGEQIMNRFKLMMMSMNRPRLLLLSAFAVAVTVFVSDISVTYAEQGSHDVQPAARQEHRNRPVPAALKDKLDAKRAADAERARANRAVLINRRKAQLDFTRKVLEGQENAPAPDRGGAK
jgi:hypothetical protein